MGALISLAFGTGNFLGTMCGVYFHEWFTNPKCLKFRPENKEVQDLYHKLFKNNLNITSSSISQRDLFNYYTMGDA